VEVRAALTDEYRSAFNYFTREFFNAQALRLRIATVNRGYCFFTHFISPAWF